MDFFNSDPLENGMISSERYPEEVIYETPGKYAGSLIIIK